MKENSINHIWKHRKRAKLGQKNIAYLLGHSGGTEFSKWEAGKRLPNLQNALKLSYIFQTPVESLFSDLYRDLGEEVEERRKSLPKEVKRSNHEEHLSSVNS